MTDIWQSNTEGMVPQMYWQNKVGKCATKYKNTNTNRTISTSLYNDEGVLWLSLIKPLEFACHDLKNKINRSEKTIWNNEYKRTNIANFTISSKTWKISIWLSNKQNKEIFRFKNVIIIKTYHWAITVQRRYWNSKASEII